jgi:hypothetical protein
MSGREKVDSVGLGEELSEGELLARFRRAILEKYRVAR